MARNIIGRKKMAPAPASRKKKTNNKQNAHAAAWANRWEAGESLMLVPSSQHMKLVDLLSFLSLAWLF